MRNIAQTLKALADETRIKMFTMIMRHGELCVCDLEQGMGISQSKASRHLRYMANAGLLEDRKEGVWVYYRVPAKPGALQRGLMKTLLSSIPPSELAPTEARLKSWLKSKNCK